jgi:hypothetical protein
MMYSIFFYPTVVYTFFVLDREQHERGGSQAERGQAGERTPLVTPSESTA